MKITRKKLRNLILEIVDGMGKEIIPLPDSFKSVEDVDDWINKAFKNAKYGGGKLEHEKGQNLNIKQYFLALERGFGFGDATNYFDFADKWGNREHRKKYPNLKSHQNLSDEKVKFYNEFGEKAIAAGVPKSAFGDWKVKTADEAIAAKQKRAEKRKLKNRKLS